MDLYNDKTILAQLEDPFGSEAWKSMDSLPLNKLSLLSPNRIDLALPDSVSADLPVYIYINRLTSLDVSSLYYPEDSNALTEIMIKLQGSV